MTEARSETIDACVLINLYATGRLSEIAAVLGLRLVVARQVSEETFYLREGADPGAERTAVDLAQLIGDGAIAVVELEESELALFVEVAARVDEGEAATITIAVARSLPIATDDRAALRLLAADHADVEVRTTSQLVRAFAQEAQLTAAETAECIRRIETLASFFPGRHDPEHDWWQMSRDP